MRRGRELILLCAAVVGLASGQAAAAEENAHGRFSDIMDSTFGAGNWRMTGGYRTPEREDQLRAEGALTVPAGVRSRHSTGTPGAPGAYDLVVSGLSPSAAAAKLRQANAPFRTLFAEGAHGSQGPHLHLEPHSTDLRAGAAARAAPAYRWQVADPTPAELELTSLRQDARQGSATAQLATAQAYARGHGAARDRVAAYFWSTRAAANPTADAAVRSSADAILRVLAAQMTPDELKLSRRLSVEAVGPQTSCADARADETPVVLLGPSGSCPRS